MKSVLSVVAVLVGAYFVFFMNAVMAYTANIPEEIADHFLGEGGIKIVVFAIFVIVPTHLFLVIWAVRKKGIEWSTGLPFFMIPYMLGASIQAIML